MSIWKTILLSFVGFITPIFAGLLVLAACIEGVSEQIFPRLFLSTDLPPEKGAGKKTLPPKVIHVGKGAQFALVQSHPVLDPEEEAKFIVSFLVRFDRLPPTGKRQRIIDKYLGSQRPYPGWAIAFHRSSTSLRPEVYWRGDDGKGGWFAFGDVQLHPRMWYALTLVVKAKDFMSLYLQKISLPFEAPLNNGSTFGKLGEPLRTASPVMFVGGHDISDVAVPKTTADLYLGAKHRGKDNFRGQVSLLLVGDASDLPETIEELRSSLDGGPSYIVQALKAERLGLWLTSSGQDESSFAHAIDYNSARLVEINGDKHPDV